ncbi:hypothetical protein [Micromonospora sp. NPDC049359]|uniref:hypothetical protein n=1 Tax=Micromonospora sp. NPDC049359 TaxID=3364270 RepID=UPI0037A1B6D3
MSETGNWAEPTVIRTGCCEGARWRLELPGPDNTRDQNRLAGLAMNPAAPTDVLLALVRDGGRLPRLVLAERLQGNSPLAQEIPDVVAALVAVTVETGDPHLLQRLLFEGDFPPDAIAAFRASSDHRLRSEVPWLKACPPETVAALADDPHPQVRRSIAFLTNVSPEIQAKLARDPDPAVRDGIGQREFSAEIAEILAHDEVPAIRAEAIEQAGDWLGEELAVSADPEARARAAQWGRLSVAAMVALSEDPVVAVRRALTWSEHVSSPLLAVLARDSDPEVRRAVALHSATSTETLTTLTRDVDETVARTAVERFTKDSFRPLPNLERLEAVADRLSVEQLQDLLGRWKSGCEPGPRPWPVEDAKEALQTLLTQCAGSRSARVRAAAAANWSLSEETAAQLAQDRNPMVRRWLARHCGHPEILRRLAETPVRGIGAALASNSRTPPDVLSRLPVKPHLLAENWSASGELLARLLDGADHVTRLAIAEHRNTRPEALAELARGDVERDVLRAACAHPALPVPVMWELLRRPA